MTAKINKDVTEDAEETDVVEAAEAAPKPAKKKVRRVRVIEVIDDEDSDEDLAEVLDALDDEDEDEAPKPKPKPKPKAAAKVEASPKEDAEDEAPASRTGFGVSPLVAALVVMLVAALASLALWQWQTASGLSGKEDRREAVSKVAGDFGNVVAKYDVKDLKGSVAAIEGFLTGDALTNFRSKQDLTTMGQSLTKAGYSVNSQTRGVYVGSVDGKFATVLLVFDVTFKPLSGSGEEPKLSDNPISLGMVKVGGKWKISSMKPVSGSASAGGTVPNVPGTGPSQKPTDNKSGAPKN